MAETGDGREQPNSSLWDTLASIQEAQPQNNNGWDQSDNWGQFLNNDAKWKSDGGSSQKEPDPRQNKNRNVRGSSRSPGGDLGRFIDRGAKQREESLSPPGYGRNATREPCRDLRRGSWSNGNNKVSTSPRCSTPRSSREVSEPDRRQGRSFSNDRTEAGKDNQPGLCSPCIKPPGPNDVNKHGKWDPRSSLLSPSRLRCRSPHSQPAQEVKKSSIEKESDGWGMNSSHVERDRSGSLSPWSQAARNTVENTDSKGTNGWGKDLDQTGTDAWNQTNCSDFLPNHGSNRWKGEHSASRSRERSISTEDKWKRTEQGSRQSPGRKWIKTGDQMDSSRCRERSISPEKRPNRSGCSRGRSRGRGRGRNDSRSHSRLNRSRGSSPNNNKTKDGREKHLGFSPPKRNCSDQIAKAASDRWGAASPNMDESRSRVMSGWSQPAQESLKNANHKESDGWDQNSSPVKKERSRSSSPWSQAAMDIDKNYNNKETDGWGTALEQNGPDAWNQPMSNLSEDRGFKRRGEANDRSRSPAPKWRKTGRDMDRSRGRDNSYSPDDKQRRPGWNRVGSRYRGGHASSPRYQDRREKKYPSYSPSRSRRSPNLQANPSHERRLEQDGEKINGSENRYEKKTKDGDDATKVTSSWEGPKWHDWSVNALRSSLKEQNLNFNWSNPSNTGDGNGTAATHTTTIPPEFLRSGAQWALPGVADNSMAAPDAYHRTEQRGVVVEEAITLSRQISSQNHSDVKQKGVKNSPGIEHPMNGTPYLPLSYDPWDNDATIASSDATNTHVVNPTASQPSSNHQNHNPVSGLTRRNLFPSAPWSSAANMTQGSCSTTWGPSTAPFKYPSLEPKLNIGTASNYSNCGGTKPSLVPSGGGPSQMLISNAPTTANGVNTFTPPSARLSLENLPPSASTDCAVSSTSSSAAIFSNTDAAKKITPLRDTNVRTSKETDTEPKVIIVNKNVVARFSEPNIDAVVQTVSRTETNGEASQSRELDTRSESSAVGAVEPTPMVTQLGRPQSNQNPIMHNGTAAGIRTGEADWVSISRALVNFAKPTVKRHWQNGLLTDANYKEVLDKFWRDVHKGLLTSNAALSNIHQFIINENDSLSSYLQVCIDRCLPRES